MKRMILAGLTVLALVPMAALPAAAGNPRIYHTITNSHGNAGLVQDDECERTEVFVSSMVAMYAAQPGPVNKQGLTGVGIRVTDTCATPGDDGEIAPMAAGGAILFEMDVQDLTPLVVEGRLRNASVSTTITDEETGLTLALSVTWVGTGTLEVDPSHVHVLFPGEGMFNTADNNVFRDAVADVSVSVSDGNVPVLALSGVDEFALLDQVKWRCIENPRPGVEGFYPCLGYPG